MYDSTTNFVGSYAELLVGQELYVIPQPDDLQKYGFRGFYKKYKNTNYTLAQTTTYSLFADKTFLVEEVLPGVGTGSYYKTTLVLKLKEITTDSIWYFLYHWDAPSMFPFFIRGFYEKERTCCTSKQVVLKNKNPWENIFDEKKIPIYDVLTGLPINIDPQEIWQVKELVIDHRHGELSYIITNSKDQTFSIGLNAINNFIRRTGPCALWYDEVLKKIHDSQPEFYKSIMEDEIRIGMSPHMVQLAWGNPKEKHHSSFGDVWIYASGKHLYFKEGKLKSFY